MCAKKPPARGLHPLTLFLIQEAERQGVTDTELMGRAGWSRALMGRWRVDGCAPSLNAISDCLEVLGYRIVAEPNVGLDD